MAFLVFIVFFMSCVIHGLSLGCTVIEWHGINSLAMANMLCPYFSSIIHILWQNIFKGKVPYGNVQSFNVRLAELPDFLFV